MMMMMMMMITTTKTTRMRLPARLLGKVGGDKGDIDYEYYL
jgi:hypothetical protein